MLWRAVDHLSSTTRCDDPQISSTTSHIQDLMTACKTAAAGK